MEEFIEHFQKFREWLNSTEETTNVSAVRDKFDELGLNDTF